MTYRNYHMILAPDRSAVTPDMDAETAIAATVWTCDYCGAKGSFEELRKSDCSFAYAPCEHCGGSEHSNECKPDCVGMAQLLGTSLKG